MHILLYLYRCLDFDGEMAEDSSMLVAGWQSKV